MSQSSLTDKPHSNFPLDLRDLCIKMHHDHLTPHSLLICRQVWTDAQLARGHKSSISLYTTPEIISRLKTLLFSRINFTFSCNTLRELGKQASTPLNKYPTTTCHSRISLAAHFCCLPKLQMPDHDDAVHTSSTLTDIIFGNK